MISGVRYIRLVFRPNNRYGSRHGHVTGWQFLSTASGTRSTTIAFGSSIIVYFFQKYQNQVRARRALHRQDRAIPSPGSGREEFVPDRWRFLHWGKLRSANDLEL